MTTMEERERAFEAKFAHDAEMQFRAEARRDKLLGLWAAELLGKTGKDAMAYAGDVIKSDLAQAGDADVFRKVSGDLDGRVSDADLRAKMEEMLIAAKAQLIQEI